MRTTIYAIIIAILTINPVWAEEECIENLIGGGCMPTEYEGADDPPPVPDNKYKAHPVRRVHNPDSPYDQPDWKQRTGYKEKVEPATIAQSNTTAAPRRLIEEILSERFANTWNICRRDMIRERCRYMERGRCEIPFELKKFIWSFCERFTFGMWERSFK